MEATPPGSRDPKLNTSVFEIFKIGIGPSSSHTVGPMRAARAFVANLEREGKLAQVDRVLVELYGSLALTGKGHGTDRAIVLGLLGEVPDKVDPATVDSSLQLVRETESINLLGRRRIPFAESADLLF